MNEDKMKEIMLAYTVPGAEQEQIKITQKRAREAVVRITSTRPFSLWKQIRVQATFLSKWFYAGCFLITIICLMLSAATGMERTDSIFFGICPLFILPCAAAASRTFSSGMLELEAACKYSLTKLFAGKLLVLGGIVTVCVFILGMPVCLSGDGFSARPLLLGLVSFTLTVAVILWFGKRNIKRGFVCGALWSGGMAFLALWEESYKLFNTVNIGLILLVLTLGFACAVLTVYRFSKEIFCEGARETWSFSLTA